MESQKRAYVELHLAVLLFGFTAILGDFISLSALLLVWWRMGLTTLSIPIITRVGHAISKLPRKLIYQYMGIGVIVSLHWLCFFGSVKLANASIALICMATTSFFTSLLEPFIFKRKINYSETLLGILMIPGILLIVNDTPIDMISGIVVGLSSAFLAALFSTLNKTLVEKASPMVITFLELGSGWLFMTLLLPLFLIYGDFTHFFPQGMDWLWLCILAFACTTFAYWLALRALKHLSAFASNLTINLEPIYGIFLAWILLDDHEELSLKFYIGCAIILGAVFFHSFKSLRNKDKRE